jgi:hypothetical protein
VTKSLTELKEKFTFAELQSWSIGRGTPRLSRRIGENAYTKFYEAYFDISDRPWKVVQPNHPPIAPKDDFDSYRKKNPEISDNENNRRLFNEKKQIISILDQLSINPERIDKRVLSSYGRRVRIACDCLRLKFYTTWEKKKVSIREVCLALWKEMILVIDNEKDIMSRPFDVSDFSNVEEIAITT